MTAVASVATASVPDLPHDAVEIDGLSKVYKGGKRALNDVNFTIRRGSMFALLGPNGAGKSTLINILAGLVLKTSGTARIWGHDIIDQPRAAKMAIGIVPQELNLDPFFTPRELLDLQAGLYGVPPKERRTDELLDAVGLADKSDAYARTLSGGMRRRLMVAKAMVHDPPVLVLDEPTAGVDIELRQSLWNYVRELNRAGTTVLLTTHYLEEAEELCDTIAIINHGSLVALEDKTRMLGRVDSKTLSLEVDRPLDTVPEPLEALGAQLTAPTRLAFTYQPSRTCMEDLLDAVRATGLTIQDLTTDQADLEDVFLQVTRADDGRTG